MEDHIKIKGHVSLKHYDGDDNLLTEWDGDNLVTLDGAEFLARKFTGDSIGDCSPNMKYYAIGYNGNSPRVDDEMNTFQSLTPQFTGISYSGWSKDNATITYDFISPSGFHIGVWREAALLTSGDSPIMFNRVLMPELNKQNDSYVISTWKLNF